jgi:TP901 family phage tail tape measure protein
MADAQANINVNVNTADALAQIRALQRQLSSFYSEMAKGGANANAQMANMQQSLVNSVNATGKFSASMTTVRSGAEGFTNALEKNKLSLGEYFRFAGGASQTFGKLFRSEFDTINKVARERVKTLQTQFVRLGRNANGAMQAIKVRPLALDMENLGTKVQMTAQKQQLFNQLVKQGSTNLLNFGKNTQWAGRQLMVGFTIPLVLFGTAATKAFQKIEEQAIKFRRVYGDMFTTTADTEKALSTVRELAEEFTKYGIAVEKTMDLAAKVAQMGNVGKALEEQVTQATRLSVLGGMEQMDALDTTISLTNAFGIEIEDLAKKIDFLNAAENQTILAIEDFNTAIPLTGTVVNELGGSVEDLAVLLTAMREAGINASQGGNALKSSLARLIAPSRNAKETLAGFGINVMGIVENNAGNLMGTIMSLGRELDNLDPLSRARAIEALFGKFQFARMSALFSNITREGSQAAKVLDLTKNSAEELAILSNRELGRVEESAATKFQKTLEQIQSALAPIGEEFLKAITPIVEFATKLLKHFNSLSDGTKQFVTNMIGLVGLVAPVFLMGLGLVFNLIANGIKAFQFFGKVLLGLSGKSRILGGGLDYLNQEQIEGLAAAGSLEQAHIRLQQTFTSEEAAVRRLIDAYRAASIAQRGFGGMSRPSPIIPAPGFSGGKMVPGYSKGKSVPGYSNGVFMVPGKTSDGDAQPAMLTAGEAVISEPMTRKYGGLINAMISDNIPGYIRSKRPGQRVGTVLGGPGEYRSVSEYAPFQAGNQSSAGADLSAISQNTPDSRAAYRGLFKAGMLRESGQQVSQTNLENISTEKVDSAIDELVLVISNSVTPEMQSIAEVSRAAFGKLIETVDRLEEEGRLTAEEARATRETIRKTFAPTEEDLSVTRVPRYDAKQDQETSEVFLARKSNETVGTTAKDQVRAATMFERGAIGLDPEIPEDHQFAHQTDALVRKKDVAPIKIRGDAPILQNMADRLDMGETFKEGQTLELKQLGNQDGSAYSDGVFEASSEKMVAFIDNIKKATGHNSPHPFWKPQGVEDGQAYGEGYNQGAAETISSPGTNGLKPPPPPQAPVVAPPTRGRKIANKILDSGPSKAVGKFLAKQSGVAVTDSKGEVFYDPNEDESTEAGRITAEARRKRDRLPGGKDYVPPDPNAPPPPSAVARQINTELRDKGLITDNLEQTPLGVASGIVPVKVVDGKVDIGENSIDNLANVSPTANEAAESGQLTAAAKDNRAAADQIAESNEDLAKTTEKSTKERQRSDKEIKRENARQNRQKRSGGALRVLGTATMVAGMATQVDGVVGETAQKIVGPLAALSGIVPLLSALPLPLAALVAVIGAGVAAWMIYNNAIKTSVKEAYELSTALGTGKEAIQKFAEFSGKVTDRELFESQRAQRFDPFQVASGKSTFGEGFFGNQAGESLASSVKLAMTKMGRDVALQKIFMQLGQAVGEGALSIPEARSIATEMGNQLGDMSFGIELNGKLMQLLGPGGEDLLAGERLTILAEIREQRSAEIQELEFKPIASAELRTPGSDPNLRRSEIVEELGGGFYGGLRAFFTSAEWHEITFGLATGITAQKQNMEQLGEILSMGTASADTFASEIALINAAYSSSLEKAYAQSDQYEISRLERERSEEIQKTLEIRKQNQDKIIEELEKDMGKSSIAMKNIIDSRFGEDRETANVYKKALADISGLDLEESVTLELQYMLSTGDMNLGTIQSIVSNFDARPDVSQKLIEIQTELGGVVSGDIQSVAANIKDEDLKAEFILSFNSEEIENDIDAVEKRINAFGQVSRVSSLFPEGEDIVLKYVLENPEEIERINEDLQRLEGVEDKDVTIDFITQHFGEPALSAAKAIWDEIPTEDRKDALYSIIASMGVIETPEFQELFNALKGQTIAGVTISKPADILSMLGSRVSGIASGNRGLGGGDTEPPASGGGSKEGFDSLLKQLRDLRLATIDMKRGWDGMMESLQKVFEGGTKSINIFDGLSNQIRKFGVGQNLIEMIVGMDPDEYEKRKGELFTFDDKGSITGITAKLRNMNAAFNAIALGEYVNEQQRSLQTMRDQISAISILTANGLSLAEAYDMVQNEAVAAAIAMGATREEIMELISLTRQISALRKKTEKEEEKANASKAVRKSNEDFEKRVAVLNKLSKAAGQYTNAQIEALFGDSNLQTLFLNPSVDPKALQKALDNAAREAQLQIDIQLASESGRNKLFEEGFGKAMEAFSIQEQTIDLKFRAEVADDESIMRAAESQIAGLRFELDDYQAEITRIEDQEQDINDAYEKRFEALDKIAQANEEIAAAQKSQLDIADALTRGDIAAAARAVQEARSQQADNAAKSEREQLERARDSQLKGLTGIGGLNREQLEERIRGLQMEIFNIEEDMLEPAQERIRLAQELRDEQIRSLEVLGKTREEWDAIRNSVDVARMDNWEFVESMQRALDLVKQIIEDLGKPKPVPPPPPAPSSSSGSGGSGLPPKGEWINTQTGQTLADEAAAAGMHWTDYYNEHRELDAVLTPPTRAASPSPSPSPRPPSPQNLPAPPPPPAPKPAPAATGSSAEARRQELLRPTPAPAPKPTPSPRSTPLQPQIQPRIAPINPASGGMIVPKRMAMGGQAKGYPMGGLIPYKAAGGFFKSLGSDTIPAMLTPGEFVVRRPAVRGFGVDKLEKINNGTYSDGSMYNYNLAVNVKSNADPERIARTVIKHIERVDSQKIRGNRI